MATSDGGVRKLHRNQIVDEDLRQIEDSLRGKAPTTARRLSPPLSPSVFEIKRRTEPGYQFAHFSPATDIPYSVMMGCASGERCGSRTVPYRTRIDCQGGSHSSKGCERIVRTPILITELQNFKVKIPTAGNDIYGEWQEGQHYDLSLQSRSPVGRRPVRD